MEGHVDDNMVLSDGQVVGTDGSDEASTNTVRLPVDSGDELGPGNPLYLNVMVATTFAGGTSINFEVQDAADDGDGSPDTFGQVYILDRSRTVANNQLDKKKKIMSLALPVGTREHVRLLYDVTGSMTAGAIDAWLSDHPLSGVD